MKLLNQTYSVQEAAKATGATAKQISDWCNIGLITGQRERLGRGHRRELSWSNVMQIASAMALMQIGLSSPGDAFRAAQKLAYTGNDDQLVGLPYHQNLGETYLCVCGDQSVVLWTDDDKLPRNPIPNSGAFGFIALNLSEVFRLACSRLGGADAHQILDEAYPEAASK